MSTDFYDYQRRAFPLSMANATHYTRTGNLDTKRGGGPGTRSKNPKRFDDEGKRRKDAANA